MMNCVSSVTYINTSNWIMVNWTLYKEIKFRALWSMSSSLSWKSLGMNNLFMYPVPVKHHECRRSFFVVVAVILITQLLVSEESTTQEEIYCGFISIATFHSPLYGLTSKIHILSSILLSSTKVVGLKMEIHDI